MAQAAYDYKVRGRVVDEDHQPVAHAYVVLDAGLTKTWEDVTYFVEADDSGHFSFFEPEKTTNPSRQRFLYAIGPIPGSSYSPVKPPFNRIPRLFQKRFAARSVLIKKNDEIDVGDVPIRIKYGTIDIELQDPLGRPLLKDASSWRYVWLRIRNHQGNTVSYGGLSMSDIDKAVNVRQSSITLALPEGSWYVDVSLKEDKGPRLTSSQPIIVRSNDKPGRRIL